MVASARLAYQARRGAEYGVRIDLIGGEAHFTGPKTVEIALADGRTRQISAPVVVIDAGTRPRPLAITGVGDVPCSIQRRSWSWTSSRST
jgi:pyruvate/2-oxoglutarate dehydrogenase complex dihydrolipoamide dehydrogenase (E3) component